MVFGIGMDIIEIGRIEKAISQKGFLERFFTQKELEFFKERKTESVAGNFCVKEAFVKAVGTGFRGIFPIDIEVLRNEQGMPVVFLYGGAKLALENYNIKNIHASISHCKEFAGAVVILES